VPSKLGIFAGTGRLPDILAHSCTAQGRDFQIYVFDGEQYAQELKGFALHKVKIASVGAIFKLLKEHEVSEVVFAGKINRPGFSSLIPDLTGAKLLAKIASAKLLGDDALIKVVIEFIESAGFKVVGTHQVSPELITPTGNLTKSRISSDIENDIKTALEIARKIGVLDIGQAIIFQAGRVLAVEAAEGTDEMIKRTSSYIKNKERAAILVKIAKPNQELRVDMPVIGIDTVKNCIAAGIGGIAIESGSTMIIDREAVIREANKKGLFVAGC